MAFFECVSKHSPASQKFLVAPSGFCQRKETKVALWDVARGRKEALARIHLSEVVSEGVPKHFCRSTELLQVPGQCFLVSLALLRTWIQWILISCAARHKGKCLLNAITRDVVSWAAGEAVPLYCRAMCITVNTHPVHFSRVKSATTVSCFRVFQFHAVINRVLTFLLSCISYAVRNVSSLGSRYRAPDMCSPIFFLFQPYKLQTLSEISHHPSANGHQVDQLLLCPIGYSALKTRQERGCQRCYTCSVC